jgi:hypothetical protein
MIRRNWKRAKRKEKKNQFNLFAGSIFQEIAITNLQQVICRSQSRL